MWDDRRSAPWHCIAGMKEDCLIYPSGRGGIMSYGESSCLLAAHGPEDRFGGALPDFREQGTTAAARRSAGIVSL